MYYACMPALQIRDVPDEVRDTLAERARANGQSLQVFLLALVQDEARRSNNRALLDRFADRSDGSQVAPEDAVGAIERARAERDEQILDRRKSSSGGAA